MRDAWAPLQQMTTAITFFGHTHVQGGFSQKEHDWHELQPALRPRDDAEILDAATFRRARATSSIPAPSASRATTTGAPPSPSTTAKPAQIIYHRVPTTSPPPRAAS